MTEHRWIGQGHHALSWLVTEAPNLGANISRLDVDPRRHLTGRRSVYGPLFGSWFDIFFAVLLNFG